MTVLPIRTVGDPVLRTPTTLVTEFGTALGRLVTDMIDTMYDAPGVGLAAPQIGVGLRLFVFDVDYDPRDESVPRVPRVVVNPVLELGPDPGQPGEARQPGGTQQHGPEGCLSVPGLHFPTTRALAARVRGVDVTGQPVEYAGEGLLARCFQHEVDHLDGILYVDRLTGEARRAAVQALREPSPTPEQARAAGEYLRSRRRSGRAGDGQVSVGPGRVMVRHRPGRAGDGQRRSPVARRAILVPASSSRMSPASARPRGVPSSRCPILEMPR